MRKVKPARTRIKVCGMTELRNAMEVAATGVDALGFIFAEQSPRFIEPAQAGAICRRLPPFVTKVGVFVDAPLERMEEAIALCGLDLVQLHGQEPPELCEGLSRPCIKAIRVGGEKDLERMEPYRGRVAGFLLDTWSAKAHGGTGETFDWGLARLARERHDEPVILAGGLHPGNVAEAVELVRPWAVDLNSGVEEAPGRKDRKLVARAVEMVRRADGAAVAQDKNKRD